MSTLPFNVPQTFVVDPGCINIACGWRVGSQLANAAVFAPHRGGVKIGERFDAEREIWTPTGEPTRIRSIVDIDLIDNVRARVLAFHDFCVRRYAQPGPIRTIAEIPHGPASGRFGNERAVTQHLAVEIAKDLRGGADHPLSQYLFKTRPGLCAGELHHAKRPAGTVARPVEECYPPNAHDTWMEWAHDDIHGNPVRMGPNEDRGKRGGKVRELRRRCRDVQACFDCAFYKLIEHDEDLLDMCRRGEFDEVARMLELMEMVA